MAKVRFSGLPAQLLEQVKLRLWSRGRSGVIPENQEG